MPGLAQAGDRAQQLHHAACSGTDPPLPVPLPHYHAASRARGAPRHRDGGGGLQKGAPLLTASKEDISLIRGQRLPRLAADHDCPVGITALSSLLIGLSCDVGSGERAFLCAHQVSQARLIVNIHPLLPMINLGCIR